MEDTGRANHIEDVLIRLHTGQWIGWSDSKNKIYENLVIHHSDKDKPTQEFLESELVSLQNKYDSDKSSHESNLSSAKTKLEGLGLTVDEVKSAFGI